MTQLSHISRQFDQFLFAPLHESGETPLSVLSALARQDIDAWEEAARLAQLSKDHAVNSLASTIWKSNSERWSPSEASIVAARLIELLPSPDGARRTWTPYSEGGKLIIMWLVYGIIFGSIAISGNINAQSAKNSKHPNQTNIVVGQQQVVPQPSQETSTD